MLLKWKILFKEFFKHTKIFLKSHNIFVKFGNLISQRIHGILFIPSHNFVSTNFAQILWSNIRRQMEKSEARTVV